MLPRSEGFIALANVQTLEGISRASVSQTSFALVMLAIAAGESLVLSIVGIYGAISYVAAQRAREVGIRVALGAEPADVSRLFVRQTLVLASLDTSLGVGGAWAVSRWMASLLFGVSTTDPLTYVAVSAGLAVVAGYLPSRRAACADPVVSLRAATERAELFVRGRGRGGSGGAEEPPRHEAQSSEGLLSAFTFSIRSFDENRLQ